MLGAVVRAAGFFVFGMLLSSLLSKIIGMLIPLMDMPDGTTPGYVEYFEAINQNWPVIIMLAIVFAIVARASVEAKLGGAG